MSLWAGILAAGAGRRMGQRPKALLPFRGHTFLEEIAATSRRGGVDGVAIVLGHHKEAIRPLASEICDRLALNPDPELGMASSARALVRVIPKGAAMLLWPVDLPAVRAETVRTLIAEGERHPGHLIVPARYEGGPCGHPPLLPPASVQALRTIADEARLDQALEAMAAPRRIVVVDDGGIVDDVDRPEDLAALEATDGRPRG